MTRESIEASYLAGQITRADYEIMIGFCDQIAERAKLPEA
jgi:hypothetical protein